MNDIRDLYVEMNAWKGEIDTYQVLSRGKHKDLEKEDIIGVMYVSNPLPSTYSYYHYLGLYKDDVIFYQGNEDFEKGNDILKRFHIVKSLLVDMYHPSLWGYPKTDMVIIDGHEYEIILVLKNQKKIVYEARNEYVKAFDTLMYLLGSDSRSIEYDDSYYEIENESEYI